MSSPLLFIHCYSLFIIFQQIFHPYTSIEINQMEPVSQNGLTDALCQSFLEFQLYTVDTFSQWQIHVIPFICYYLKTVNLSRRIYSSHSSLLLFLSITDDLVELKIVTDFSHLISTPLFRGTKSAFFSFKQFYRQSERFFILASNSL